MDNQIFNLGLSIYANSLYIVICSLVGDGASPGLQSIEGRWNASLELLREAIEELLAWRVIEKRTGPPEIGEVFIPNPASVWRMPWASED
ncbi:MAG: hypothetical protein LBV23_04265 [Deltaproteobacteria bacterium]|nr:hypothetical protein [Deltaproteobacteria bacterium]